MRDLNYCPICESASDILPTNGDRKRFDCPKCGQFEVTGTALVLLNEDSTWRALRDGHLDASLGHWVQEQQRFGQEPILTSETIEIHRDNPHFPSVQNQVEKLIRVIGDIVGAPGPKFQFDASDVQFKIGCKTVDGVMGLAEYVRDRGYIGSNSTLGASGSFIASMTVNGWLEYERLLSDQNAGRKAFIAMPFNKSDLDDKWLPRLREAVAQTGYELERVDDNPEPGLIDTRMKLQIRAARFLLVELTHGNHGAYWEAGMAEGLGLPVIYLQRKGDDSEAHFDVEHSFRVGWDPNDMEPALEKVKATIRNAMPDALMEDKQPSGRPEILHPQSAGNRWQEICAT